MKGWGLSIYMIIAGGDGNEFMISERGYSKSDWRSSGRGQSKNWAINRFISDEGREIRWIRM